MTAYFIGGDFMYMNLYQNGQDRRVIGKTLTNGFSINDIEIKQDTNILKPSIIIKYFSGVMAYNYCYISIFDRYYFIDNIQVLSGGRVELICSVDVLNTYATEIKALNAILTRGSIGQPTMIIDNRLPLKQTKNVKTYEFSGGDFNIDTATKLSNNFVLNIMGGGSTENRSFDTETDSHIMKRFTDVK